MNFSNTGRRKLLMRAFKDANLGLKLKLFSNNITPSNTDDENSFTEVVGNGYSAHSINANGITFTAGAPAVAAFGKETFTFTGAAGVVYGWYLTDGADIYIGGERFTDPITISYNGDVINVTPTINLS